jgi:DNA processing protein
VKLNEEKKLLLSINMIENINSNLLIQIFKKFEKLTDIFNYNSNEKLDDSEKRYLKKIIEKIENYNKALEFELEKIEEDNNLNILTIFDEEYPDLLKGIDLPPIVLYLKGDLDCLKYTKISIVGSRFCTEYGAKIAKALAFELASMGIVVVSGLALGIDSFAHSGAIKSGGRTIAVLGSGLYNVYPYENKELFNQIIKSNGLVISEFPLFTKPERYNFPKRNRIISGLSLGTVIVEASLRSGALITASYALEQGRILFAVPGPLQSENSKGTNKLIKEGAKLVQNVDDIIEELNLKELKTVKISNNKNEPEEELSEEEKIVLKFVDYTPRHIDEIIKNSKLKANVVERNLIMLEIKGIVQQLPGHKFVLTE